jgi:hypothetical protein
MDPGHIPDMAHGMIMQSSWVQGLPIVRRFLGGIKYNRKLKVPIIAYRCTRCGYLELYAGE